MSKFIVVMFFFFQAEDGIRDLVRSRGLGDVYKRQAYNDVIPHFSYVLTVAIVLFAFSTMISWSYYGLQAWKFLFGLSLIHISEPTRPY